MKLIKETTSDKLAESLVESAWRSGKALSGYIPHHVPEPIDTGRCASSPKKHFYLSRFVDTRQPDTTPNAEHYMAVIAMLHRISMGKMTMAGFGFNTRFGDVNQFSDLYFKQFKAGKPFSWKECFTNQMEQYFTKGRSVREENP